MKPIILALSSLNSVNAHYVFSRLIANNIVTKDFEYIRPLPLKNDGSDWTGVLAPLTDPLSLAFRCGPNATTSGPQTKTMEVRAGDTVGFEMGEPHFRYGNFDPYDVPRLYHPGPLTVWLSKAPNDDLDSYTGDGDWFKILQVIERTEQSIELDKRVLFQEYPSTRQWGAYLTPNWNFTIPATTPPGKYLLRFEHIQAGIVDGSYVAKTQYYQNCAQISIVNEGSRIGTPGPLVKIPGTYADGQPEFIWDDWDMNFDIKKFKMPGPAVWQG
ncbi:hypothetical protein N0V90_012397 [Kalmusia sp. IMI 367209]|nr:hypothetical protein N0V90_012397 [Kalmusia sp. IMI 367209]